MKIYHGSTRIVKKPNLLRGRKNTDFGKGFYTTTSYEQAKKWALIKRNRESDPQKAKAIVSIYEVDDDILSKNYLIRHFDGATLDWLNFVISNRKGHEAEKNDMVMGPVANDKLYATLLLYEQGALTAIATIEQLKTHTLFDQLSFHSSKVLEEIHFLYSEEVYENGV